MANTGFWSVSSLWYNCRYVVSPQTQTYKNAKESFTHIHANLSLHPGTRKVVAGIPPSGFVTLRYFETFLP